MTPTGQRDHGGHVHVGGLPSAGQAMRDSPCTGTQAPGYTSRGTSGRRSWSRARHDLFQPATFTPSYSVAFQLGDRKVCSEGKEPENGACEMGRRWICGGAGGGQGRTPGPPENSLKAVATVNRGGTGSSLWFWEKRAHCVWDHQAGNVL